MAWLSDPGKATHKLLQLKTVLMFNLQEESVKNCYHTYEMSSVKIGSKPFDGLSHVNGRSSAPKVLRVELDRTGLGRRPRSGHVFSSVAWRSDTSEGSSRSPCPLFRTSLLP